MANPFARALRKNLTPQEVKLWVKLRELKAFGFHFRWQAPIRNHIVDFASFRNRVVIELMADSTTWCKARGRIQPAMLSCVAKDFACCGSGISKWTAILTA